MKLGAQNKCQMLCNSDFEESTLVAKNNFTIIDQSKVPCWKTTATDKMIEVWGSGFLGAPAYSGNQFIELNANMVATLYQDFTAVLSSSIQLSFAHRGRSGVDVLSVEIGPVGGPYHSFGNFSADNKKWSYHTVSYTFPNTGTTKYTLRFNSISAAGGSQSVGNLLDAISVYMPEPKIESKLVHPGCEGQNNGSIELKLTGGNQPYSYNWNPPAGKTTAGVENLGAGNYHVDITDIYGCKFSKDYVLKSANQTFNKTISITACDSFYWSATGKMYKNSGVYKSSFTTVAGCDSNITLNLRLGNNFNAVDSATVCDSYYWPFNKTTYSQSGVYRYVYKTATGCDSAKTLYVKINHGYQSVLEIKSKLPYTWAVNGERYAETGEHKLVFHTAMGCDSVLVLKFVLDKEDSVFIPDAFTPDGNYINENWGPKGNNINWFKIIVFNRWGGQIWTGNQNETFTGNCAGKPVQQGVYPYLITIMNKESEVKYFRGNITLLR